MDEFLLWLKFSFLFIKNVVWVSDKTIISLLAMCPSCCFPRVE